MTVVVMGDEALVAKFKAADAALRASERSWIGESGEIVRNEIKANIVAQGLVEDGDLLKSGRLFYATAHGITVGFGKGLTYAPALELGADMHWILASKVENLKFFWEREGMQFYGPRVLHPGNRPYRFMRNGSEAAIFPLMTMFKERLKAIFGGSI